MINTAIAAYLDELREELKGIDASRRESILQEVRAHLEEETDRTLASKPALAPLDAAASAIRAFGTPAEVAEGYASPGTAGAERGRRDPGRRRRRRLIAGLSVGALLVLAIAVGALVYSDEHGRPPSRKMVYDFQAVTDKTGAQTYAFYVGPDDRYADVRVQVSVTSGCATVKIVDPSGSPVFDSTGACGGLEQSLRLSMRGNWRIEFQFAAFTGSFMAGAWGIGK